MTEGTQHMQALGETGEACHECGASLAADQRYCLNCGRRRGEPRVDFQRHLPVQGANTAGEGIAAFQPAANGATPPPAVPPATAQAAGRPQHDYAPLAAVGGIAVLGVMLLLGVLIGRGGEDSTSPAPQVVRLGDEGGTAAASSEEDSAGPAHESKAKGGKAKASGKKATDAGGLTGGKAGAGPVEASDEALQELQEQSPEEYQESSAKLPDEIATGGAPPPKDNKAPGGGSKGTAIE